MVLIRRAPECPGTVQQVAVQHGAHERYRLEDREHRSCFSGVKKEDENIQNGEIDDRINNPDHAKAKKLNDMGLSRCRTRAKRIRHGDRAFG